MLVELNVENFAVVEKLSLRLEPGFNVLTGETGAGKSILIDAVAGLLGARLGPEFVRAGADAARVEGVFNVGAELTPELAELGVEPDDGAVIVSRDVPANGRGVARVNGRAVPTATLAQLAPRLVDIHGQTDNLSLLRASAQLLLLDAFGGLDAERQAVAERVGELRRARRERESLQRDERELARTLDLLRFQADEIEAAKLQAGEDDELASERELLVNASRLIELGETAYAALYEGADEVRPAVELLGQAADALAELARVDPTQEALAGQVRDLALQAGELAREVRAYRDRVDVDPALLAQVEERLELLRTLKRKYGATIDEVVQFQARVSEQIVELENSESRVAELLAREAELDQAIGAIAEALSTKRRAAAERLSTRVEEELRFLNMASARFAIAIERAEQPDLTGFDRVEFQVAPNPGEPLRSLAKIASGGETARLMLALKAALAEVDDVPVLIFDEVDAGVGGRSGHVIGEKLAELSRNHQVLCVTHLPQVASYADAHFRIVKSVEGERTRTSVERLADDARIEELAAMLGGTEHGVEQARALLELARSRRASDGGPALRELLPTRPPSKEQRQAAPPRVSGRRGR
jgi:DNA repair protein RecN (Recombination protein N)